MKYLDCYFKEYPSSPVSSYEVEDGKQYEAVKQMQKHYDRIVIRDVTHGCNPQPLEVEKR